MSSHRDVTRGFWKVFILIGLKPSEISLKHKCIAFTLFTVSNPVFILLLCSFINKFDNVTDRFIAIQVILMYFISAMRCVHLKTRLPRITSMMDKLETTLQNTCVPEDLSQSHRETMFLLKILAILNTVPSVCLLIISVLAPEPFLPIVSPKDITTSKLTFACLWIIEAISMLYGCAICIITNGYLIYMLVSIKGISRSLCKHFENISNENANISKETFRKCVHLYCDFYW